MRKLLATVIGLIASLAVPVNAQADGVPSIRQSRQAIHRVDAYAVIGRCHRTRYSVVCKVAHEIEACTEDGACSGEAIYLVDRVHTSRGRAVVSVLWQGTASVSV